MNLHIACLPFQFTSIQRPSSSIFFLLLVLFLSLLPSGFRRVSSLALRFLESGFFTARAAGLDGFL